MGLTGMENKQKICDLLAQTLRETMKLQDLDYLEYNQNRELVYAYFLDGRCGIADVIHNDGLDMIQNIIGQIT